MAKILKPRGRKPVFDGMVSTISHNGKSPKTLTVELFFETETWKLTLGEKEAIRLLVGVAKTLVRTKEEAAARVGMPASEALRRLANALEAGEYHQWWLL